MFASAKGKQQKSRFDNYSVRNSVLTISHITFRDFACTFFPTTFLEIAVYKLVGFTSIMHSVNVIRFFSILLAKVSNEQINVFLCRKMEVFFLNRRLL